MQAWWAWETLKTFYFIYFMFPNFWEILYFSSFCLLGQQGFKRKSCKEKVVCVFLRGNYLLIQSINIVKHPIRRSSLTPDLSPMSHPAVCSLERLAQQTPAWVHENVLFLFCYTCFPALRGLLSRLSLCMVHVGKIEGVLSSEVWMENNWSIERISSQEIVDVHLDSAIILVMDKGRKGKLLAAYGLLKKWSWWSLIIMVLLWSFLGVFGRIFMF